jgi:hypothetical protein
VGLSSKKNKKDKIRKDTSSSKDRDNSSEDRDNSSEDRDKDADIRNTLIKRRIYKWNLRETK